MTPRPRPWESYVVAPQREAEMLAKVTAAAHRLGFDAAVLGGRIRWGEIPRHFHPDVRRGLADGTEARARGRTTPLDAAAQAGARPSRLPVAIAPAVAPVSIEPDEVPADEDDEVEALPAGTGLTGRRGLSHPEDGARFRIRRRKASTANRDEYGARDDEEALVARVEDRWGRVGPEHHGRPALGRGLREGIA